MNTAELRGLLEEQLRLSRRLRARIRDLEQGHSAPLAVVGTGMRFPGGVASPEEYADFLTSEGTAVTPVPPGRPGLANVYHPEVGLPGHSYVRHAGFLEGVADFDADFFGISTREAEALDPQQRLLLETSWESMERAGLAVRRSDRLDAGVFVGIMASEYTERLADGDPERLDPYYGTGGGHCFAAGRISYALGLRGPTVSIDTACSSSLVALHTAARSLRARECRYALVGGANMIFSPHLMVSLCQNQALAPDGRCKPFTAAADGYGRGEGVATVVLMRYDDAVSEGRPVLALVKGTAVNHDGASSGLTVPNGTAQQEVVRAALDDAGTSPGDVSYVEAHGTGTALGDPVEAAALEEVFGAEHADASSRVLVSSVKARLGHLEAASSMASLLKVVLMLRDGFVPADIPKDDGPLSTMVPWQDYHLEVPRRHQDWPEVDTHTAGISSFGLSGTNAHAVLEAAPPAPEPSPTATNRPELLVLSARTDEALQALAAGVGTYLSRADPGELPAVCHTLRAGRAPFPRRLAVVGTSTAQLAHDVGVAAAAATGTAPAKPLRQVELVADATADSGLAAGVAALVSDLPLLHRASGAESSEPTAWLAGALEALGLTVRTSGTGEADHPATLEFRGRQVTLVPADPDQATTVFLEALAALFRAGADLRLAPLRAAGARFLPDLPTYPFERKRFWIDEPEPGRQDRPPTGQAEDRVPGSPEPEEGPTSDVGEVEQFLRTELAAVLGAGADLDLDRSFAELGGDSFTAMLFFKSVEDRYQATDIADGFSVDQPVTRSVEDLARRIVQLDQSGTGQQSE